MFSSETPATNQTAFAELHPSQTVSAPDFPHYLVQNSMIAYRSRSKGRQANRSMCALLQPAALVVSHSPAAVGKVAT